LSKGKKVGMLKEKEHQKTRKILIQRLKHKKYANKQGQKDKVEVIPHKKDGKFQKTGRSSFGNDPCPPKDEK